MPTDRRIVALLIAAGILAIVIIYGDYRSVSQTTTRLDTFEHQVCILATNSRRGDAALRRSLLLLAERATSREHIDQADGNRTAAQADADSALLYKELADALNTPTGPPLGCT